jgi:hypothetical protein
MHEDDEGRNHGDKLYCGVKSYSTGLSWLKVLAPLDPLTSNFELQVDTIDYMLANTYNVNLVVSFANPGFTLTFTETFPLTLLHPCKQTQITTSQTIN